MTDAPSPSSSGTNRDPEVVAAVQEALMRHPFWKPGLGSSGFAFGLANTAIDAYVHAMGTRHSAQASPGPREVLDALADKVSAKIAQLEHYKANDAQLDHAKTIAEGRISQANQILHWIAEAAIQHSPSVPSTDHEGGK